MTTIRQQLDDARKEIARLKKLARSNREPAAGTLGGVIQRRREDAGMGVRELAIKAGVGAPAISRIETKPEPNTTLNNLLAIANGLGVPLSEIFAEWEESQK